MTLSSQEQKRQILHNAKRVDKPFTDPNDRNYINQDLSPAKREQKKKTRNNLRADLKQRQEKGEHNLVITGNKIVHLDGHRDREGKQTVKVNNGSVMVMYKV